jgi:oligopeptide/dipeptide ABC transporter ATP-binding protein
MVAPQSSSLLEVSALTVEFPRGRGRPPLRAVDGVSFEVGPRETLALVGESGSGKTTIGRAILGLVSAKQGRIAFRGEDITHAPYRRRRSLSAEMQVVFQDPYSSLNPTRTIGQTLVETLRVHTHERRDLVAEQVRLILGRVGLPSDAASRYPANFSGGQRQRISIARALIAQPTLVICDEPTSSLDLSVQAQVLNLLRDLQDEFGLSYLFISHDLAIVRHLSHRVIVLYRGRIMEYGDAATVYARPTHPYTRALLSATPLPDPEEQRARRRERTARADDSVLSLGESCPFAPRCPHATDECRSVLPRLAATDSGTLVACHRWRELGAESPEMP